MNVDPVIRCAELRAEAHELFALLGRLNVRYRGIEAWINDSRPILLSIEKSLVEALSLLPDAPTEETLRDVRYTIASLAQIEDMRAEDAK